MYTTLVSTADLAAHLADPSVVIVDVRHDLGEPDTWGEAEYRREHLPGARFAHLDRDLSAPKTGRNGRHPLPSKEASAAVFGRLGIDAGKQVVAYDQGPGAYAARLWWMLRRLGHDAVAVLDGGMAAWKREARPLTSEASAALPAVFAIRRVAPGVAPIVDAKAVAANIASPSLLLVDARGRERYLGDVEPIDPVAGHIPGAVNRPYTENLAADGAFKPQRELHDEFAALLAGRAPDSIVHYCGSGVTACHNLLAMTHAGFAGARIYPGSWSEWSADPAHRIARGDG